MKSSEVRQKFISFFQSKNHTFVPSSSTIPIGDQTLLFTIAGMTQFKAALTGEEIRPYKRATNSQKCIRIGDLDDVGKDGRHCTMFEMLGSWSFGDYYKSEAISWAREFSLDVLKVDASKLWVTVHHSDDEAFKMWEDQGQPTERIVRLGDKDNFWAMGPTGPCGPCSELYFDQGAAVGKCEVKNFDCKAGPGCDCDRYLEFWNLVFMQFDRQEDGSLKELPFKSVDTGLGLERLTALMQGKPVAFDIDSFQGIKEAILKRAGITSSQEMLSRAQKESLNVISDHMRTLTFTLADGAHFSSEGRGYVLRRVLRRAVRHAYKLAPRFPKNESFLADLVIPVVAELGEFFPEIIQNKLRIMELIRAEETRFVATLEGGLTKFNSLLSESKDRTLSGENVFALHDTFGFPSDLTRVLCEENGYTADIAGFERCMQVQKEKSRADARFYKFDQDDSPWVQFAEASSDDKTFAGYAYQESTGTHENTSVTQIKISVEQFKRMRQLKNKLFEVVISNCPFYPEGGGQVSDSGWILIKSATKTDSFEVVDVRKTPAAIVLLLRHNEVSQEEIPVISDSQMRQWVKESQSISALVNLDSRLATARNHTATHLLHKALRDVLGDNVRQAGSLVDPKGLRFDFSNPNAVTPAQLEKVQAMVNREILKNSAVKTHIDVEVETAKTMGAVAIFDEKYEDKVRVLEIPGFSMELCGGTHVRLTGDIGLFQITSEGSVTSGVRRIEAVTGNGVLSLLAETQKTIREAAAQIKCNAPELIERVKTMRDLTKDLEKNIAALQSRLVNAQVAGLLNGSRNIDDISVICAVTEASDVKELELLVDRVKDKSVGIVCVGASIEGKAVILAAVHPTLLKLKPNLAAGKIVKALSERVDGKGGGRPDFARGGGNAPAKLPEAFMHVEDIVRSLV